MKTPLFISAIILSCTTVFAQCGYYTNAYCANSYYGSYCTGAMYGYRQITLPRVRIEPVKVNIPVPERVLVTRACAVPTACSEPVRTACAEPVVSACAQPVEAPACAQPIEAPACEAPKPACEEPITAEPTKALEAPVQEAVPEITIPVPVPELVPVRRCPNGRCPLLPKRDVRKRVNVCLIGTHHNIQEDIAAK